jgi:hypothetical protein
MPQRTEYPFDINAHQHRVEDIPNPLMKAIRETMTDSSYGNDESASFLIEESLKSKKAIRLWIDHLEVAKRCEDDQFRFLLVSFTVDKDAEGYDKEDCANYSNDDFHTFFVGNEYEELAAELSIHVPRFKESYELFLTNEETLI